MRLKALFSLFIVGVAGVALAQTPAPAQPQATMAAPATSQVVVIEEKKTDTVIVEPVRIVEPPKPPPFVFELHGFASGTLFMQDQVFGASPGQQALFVSGCGANSASCRNGGFVADKLIMGGDVRQTRLNFSVRGPEVFGGAIPKGVVEVDFFGSSEFAPTGTFGDVSILPRMRLAYAELKWGGTTIQIGQQNMLTIGAIPVSLTHIAFPVTYTAGTVGWRQPGVWGYHMLGDSFELAWSVARAGWIATQTLPTTGYTAGVASGLPAVELRGKLLLGKKFDLWLSGHWQTEDRNGAGNVANKAQWTSIDTILGTVGVRADMGFLYLQGSAWYGKNAGPLLGNILQFPQYTFPGTTGANSYFGDIFGWGAWGQAGLNLSKTFSLWYTIGVDHPLYENILANYRAGGTASTRLRNLNQVGMIRFQSGGYGIGLEYLYTRTTDLRYVDPLKGQQLAFTGNYSF